MKKLFLLFFLAILPLSIFAESRKSELLPHDIIGVKLGMREAQIAKVLEQENFSWETEQFADGYSMIIAQYNVSKLPLTIAAKAFIDGEIDGMVKVLSMDGIIVGASVVANDASGLLQQLVNAIQTKTHVSRLNEIIYAHPTTSEAISEAVLSLENKALFVPPKKV